MFLETIKNKFIEKHGGEVQNAVAYEYNSSFSRIIQEEMSFFSKDPNASIKARPGVDVESVKDIKTEDIDVVMENGEKIDLAVVKINDFSEELRIFNQDEATVKFHQLIN